MTEISVSPPSVALPRAGVGRRGVAILLDGLCLYAIIFVIVTAWSVVTRAPVTAEPVDAPFWLNVLVTVSLCLYVVITATQGQTVGMRAMSLRIVRSDGSGSIGRRRALVRSGVLILAIWGLTWVHPFLVVVYFLWMLNAHRQMPHDQIAGTVVVDARAGVTGVAGVNGVNGVIGQKVDEVQPELEGLEPPQAKALLDDLDRLGRRARGDLHAASVPLFVLGLLAAGGVAVGWSDLGALFWVSHVYWALAAPLGLVLTAWWFHRLQRRQGIGTGARPLLVIAGLVTLASLVSWLMPIGGVITAVAFLAVALTQHNRVLAVAAVAFGLVTGAEQPFRAISFGIANHFPDDRVARTFSEHGNGIVLAVLAAVLLWAGARSLRGERFDE